MKELILQITNQIQSKGGVKAFPNSMKRNRPMGCPMRFKTHKELQEGLTNEEYYIAYNLGLIGNNGHTGSIVTNAKSGK